MVVREAITVILVIGLIFSAIPFFKSEPERCLINIGTEKEPVSKWVDCSKVPVGMIVLKGV